MTTNFLSRYIYLIFTIIFSAVVLFSGSDKPFYGHHDWNGAYYSTIARNYIRYGLLETKLGSVRNSGKAEKNEFNYFTHYPHLLPILIYGSFAAFGISESSARVVPILATLLAIIAIYKLSQRHFGQETAVLSAAFYSVFPITLYFGKMPVQETLVMPFVIFSIYFYFKFLESGLRKHFILLFVFLIMAHLSNWPGYYITPLFFLHLIFFSKLKNKIILALIFPSLSIFMFFMHTIHTFFLTGEFFGGGLEQVFIYRLNLAEKPQGYSALAFIENQFRMLTIYYTRIALISSILLIIWKFSNIKKVKSDSRLQILLILLIFGITHNTVFRNMAYIHDYMIIYLTPFFALSTGFLVSQIAARINFTHFLKYIAFILLIALTFSERISYVKTLAASNHFKDGYLLGIMIAENSIESDSVLVLSNSFKVNNEVFVDYYSDRKITYTFPENLERFLQIEKYSLAVALPNYDTPISYINYLQENYEKIQKENIILFKL